MPLRAVPQVGQALPAPPGGHVALGHREIPGTAAQDVEPAARYRAGDVLARNLHVGAARPPARLEVEHLQALERRPRARRPAGRVQAVADDADRERRAAGGHVGQPRPAVALRVVAQEGRRLSGERVVGRVAADDVDVALVGGGGRMVEAERHRANPRPAVAGDVVALDRGARGIARAHEPADHVDRGTDPGRRHLGARQPGGAQRDPAVERAPRPPFPAPLTATAIAPAARTSAAMPAARLMPSRGARGRRTRRRADAGSADSRGPCANARTARTSSRACSRRAAGGGSCRTVRRERVPSPQE